MDRREALRRTALLMGGAISAPAIAGILKGCKATPGIDWTPVFLTVQDAAVVTAVAGIIIPKTDTPGAIEAGVPAFIDRMLKEVYTPEDQQFFSGGIASFNEETRKEYHEDFIDLDDEEQFAFVKKVHDAAIENDKSSDPPKRPFILMMKELTMLGFFTSEVGATQVLQYEAVPGRYRGCVPLSEAGEGRTWA